MKKNKKWTSSEIKKLLSCQTDESLMKAFPGKQVSTLRRQQRGFKQNGNKVATPKPDPKTTMVTKEQAKEIKRLRNRITLYEVVGEDLMAATKALPAGKAPPVFSVSKATPENEEELCMLFGDSHVGLTVDSKESGGLGSYSIDTFKEEMLFLRESQAKIFKIHRINTPYNTMNVFMLGDIIENRIMRESQLRLTEGKVVEQVMTAVDEIATWFAWLAQQFKEINVFAICGNHGRMTAKIGILSPTDSFDYLVYKWLEERLRNYENIKFNISESWWMAIERMGVKFYIEHGEEFRSWIGIPFYGLKRGKANVRELLRQYLDGKGRQVDFDYFMVGHIHTPSEFQGVITNGAFPGGDEYSLKRLKVGEPASQKIFSIHPTFKKTWSRDILLKNPRIQPKVKFYR